MIIIIVNLFKLYIILIKYKNIYRSCININSNKIIMNPKLIVELWYQK